jgi:hypothetical protein
VRYNILELARFLTELSVIDYFFVAHKPSTIAVASILEAMSSVPGCGDDALAVLKREIDWVIIDSNCKDLADCRQRLEILYKHGNYARSVDSGESRPESVSPVCVSYGTSSYKQINAVAPSQSNARCSNMKRS